MNFSVLLEKRLASSEMDKLLKSIQEAPTTRDQESSLCYQFFKSGFDLMFDKRLDSSPLSSGYLVKLFYLSLANAEEAIARIAARVAQGGHYVPDEIVRRRFDAGLRNFKASYRFEVNYWRWYDNSGDTPTVIEEGENV